MACLPCNNAGENAKHRVRDGVVVALCDARSVRCQVTIVTRHAKVGSKAARKVVKGAAEVLGACEHRCYNGVVK